MCLHLSTSLSIVSFVASISFSFIVTLTAIFVHKVLLSIWFGPKFPFQFRFYMFHWLWQFVCYCLLFHHPSAGHSVYMKPICVCVGVYVNVFVCCLFVSLNGKVKLPFNLSLSPLWLSPVGSPARLLDILGPFCRGEFIEETETLAVHRYPCAHIWPKGRGLDDMLTLCQQANWRILI